MTYTHQNHAYTVVYNGELYNTEDIRKELLKSVPPLSWAF